MYLPTAAVLSSLFAKENARWVGVAIESRAPVSLLTPNREHRQPLSGSMREAV